jgi:hypothetical protein
MSVGLWLPPLLIVGLGAFLWFATWLERLIPAVDGQRMTVTVDSGLKVISPRQESVGIHGPPEVELGSAVA